MAPIIDPELITIIIFLLGLISATLILIYSAILPETDDDEEDDL